MQDGLREAEMDGLLFERDGALVTLTLNRPEERNPLGEAEDAEAFAEACGRINADPTVKATILTGAGSVFSAGGNLKKMRARLMGAPETELEIRERYRRTVHALVQSLWTLEVPLITAINGPAIGLGNDIACLGDIRIAGQRASFGAPFLAMGLVPGDGGTWILTRAIGTARAAELLLTGETIDAKTALAWGLVNRVVPQDRLMAEAKALAQRIAHHSAGVLRMTKRLLREASGASFESILEMSVDMQARAHRTPEHKAAVEAFFSRSRKP
jgi:enoyl-CoA hydratase/carnithine racemase